MIKGKAFSTKLWSDDEAFMSVSAACLHLSGSLDEVVDLRVKGVSEVLLAGVLALQAQGASSDKDGKNNVYDQFHNL